MVIQNGELFACFDGLSGVLRSMGLRGSPGDLLLKNTLDEPFILELGQDEYTSSFERFSYESRENTAAFTWELGDITVHSRVSLDDSGLCFSSEVENAGRRALHSLEYPLIDGITLFGEGTHRLVHSYATGIEVDDPLENFPEDGGGLRYMPYPESFSGASMQFFAYFRQDGGGLFFAAFDGEGRQKWLNFYKHGGKLRASQIYGYEDAGPGKGLRAPWDFRVGFAPEGRWEAYAGRYKAWAQRQEWCGKGKLSEREDRARWLLDETGAVTFGINASKDRTKWIRRYREDIRSPIFHILGPDWPKTDQNFYNSVPGGMDDWFPTRFCRKNIECIRQQVDRFAPFEFDFLVAADKSDAGEIRKNLQVWPGKPKSVDKYTFTMLCPFTAYTRSLHVERDRRLVEESDCDALYYDISANNIIKTCMSGEHGHPVGAGGEMAGAYRRIYRETKEAAAKQAGRYVPAGTEMMNETLIGELDFYQARANAQPASGFELWPLHRLIRQNKARLIPLFKYVYSEYAPLRCDGWGKLTAESGDLIYHTIAKTYLWGGLFEINLEYSEMERLDGESNQGEEHFYCFDPKGFAYDPRPARFIGRCAALRLGPYGKPLRYGEMMPMVSPACRKIYRTYYMYNQGKQAGEYNDRGIILLDAVLAQGYVCGGERALYVINTSLFPEEAEVPIPAWMGSSGFPGETVKLRLAPLEMAVFFTGFQDICKEKDYEDEWKSGFRYLPGGDSRITAVLFRET